MPPHPDTDEVNEIQTQTHTEPTLRDLEFRVASLEKWLKRLIGASGVTVLSVVSFAFFLGGMYFKVSDASTKTDRLYGVVAVDKDSLQSRTAVIENKLTSIDAKLTSMDNKLNDLITFREKTSVNIKSVPSPEPTPNHP